MALRYGTVEEFKKTQMGIGVTTGPDGCFEDDAFLESYMETWEEQIDHYLGYKFGPSEEYIKYYEGTGDLKFVFSRMDINSITSIEYKHYYSTEQTFKTLDPKYYELKDNIITNIDFFRIGYMYKITYNAGRDIIPKLITQALYAQTSQMLQRIAMSGILQSDSSGYKKQIFREPTDCGFYPEVKAMLNPYRIRVFF